MANKKDIKDLLNDYNPTPPEGGWDAVQSRMEAGASTDVRDVLSEYQARPAAGQWGKINNRLIWNRFLTFRSGHFNVFYLAIILLIFSGSLLVATKPSSDRLYNPRSGEQNSLSEYSSPANIQTTNNPTANKTPTESSDNSSRPASSALANTDSGNSLTEDEKQGFDNDNSSFAPTKRSANEQAGINNKKRSATSDITSESTASETNTRKQFSFWDNIHSMPLLSLLPLPDFGPDRIQTPDTLGFDYQNKPILSDKPGYSISLSYSGLLASTGYEESENSNLSAENTDVIQRLNTQMHPLYSHGIDLNLHYKQQHFVASAGIGIAELNSVFKGDIFYTLIDSTEAYSYFENGDYVYDTTWYLNLDTLLITGDSVFSPYVDSSYNSFTDSTLVTQYDTTQANQTVNQKNRIRFVNIPVWLGYRETSGVWEYQVQAGLIASIPVQNTYTWYNPETGNLVYNSNAPFRQTIFTLGVRGYFAVSLNEHWSAGLEPAYYYRLNSLFNSDYAIRTNQHTFGVGMRVQYHF